MMYKKIHNAFVYLYADSVNANVAIYSNFLKYFLTLDSFGLTPFGRPLRFSFILFYLFIYFCSSRKMLQFKRRGISKNWIFQESFRVLSTKYEFTSFFKQFFFLNFSFISIYTKQLIKMMRTVRCVAGKCRHPLRLGNILDSFKVLNNSSRWYSR